MRWIPASEHFAQRRVRGCARRWLPRRQERLAVKALRAIGSSPTALITDVSTNPIRHGEAREPAIRFGMFVQLASNADPGNGVPGKPKSLSQRTSLPPRAFRSASPLSRGILRQQ